MTTTPKPPTEARAVKFLDESWNGKNKFSVFTRCFDCQSWGVCFPQDDKCGNCNGTNTMQFWDAQTITEQFNHRTTPTTREVLVDALAEVLREFEKEMEEAVVTEDFYLYQKLVVKVLKQIIAKQLEKAGLGKGGV